MEISDEKKGIISIFISTLGFSVIPIFAKLGIDEGYSSSLLLFYRFLFATFIFYFYLKLKKHVFFSEKNIKYKIYIGGFIYSLQCLCYFTAFKYISTSLGAIIYNTYPVFTVIFSYIFLKTKITIRMIIGIILAIIGSIFVVYSPMTENKIIGIILIILTTIFSGIYMVYSKKNFETINSIELTTYISFTCSIVFLIITLFTKNFIFINSTSILFYILCLSIFSTVIGLFGFMKAISLLDVGLVSVINLIEPFFTIIFSYILFKDSLTFLQIIGGFIIIVGVYFYEK
ncbi:DMT family transporter [Fusobacterium animalis]|uniref:DMT family transporter n=1 Tax=Fusobacterium animalis TaxID=76859 RepID=UPI0035678E90